MKGKAQKMNDSKNIQVLEEKSYIICIFLLKRLEYRKGIKLHNAWLYNNSLP
jgi:hypothetical protein